MVFYHFWDESRLEQQEAEAISKMLQKSEETLIHSQLANCTALLVVQILLFSSTALCNMIFNEAVLQAKWC